MTNFKRIDWIIIGGLIFLSLAPMVAGGVRLLDLSVPAEIIPKSARFDADPLPVIVHIVTTSIYCVFGAFQFAPSVRNANISRHRWLGRMLAPLGLLAALSGIWMTQFYPAAPNDGDTLYFQRWIFGPAMALFIILGVRAALQRNIARHRAWMIRAYAIGIGAGTQVLTNIPWMLVYGEPDGLARDTLMAAGWVINIMVAEWIIHHPHLSRQGRGQVAAAE